MSRIQRLAGHVLGTLAALAVLCVSFPASIATAGDMLAAEAESLNPARWSVLDGQVFSGEFGALGKDATGTDSWVFDDGMFLSKSCLECGFPENPYLVRFEDGKTVFETKTRCPRTDATIVWRGEIKDGAIEGVFTWTRKRWYWTIEKDFWFRGTLTEISPGETAAVN